MWSQLNIYIYIDLTHVQDLLAMNEIFVCVWCLFCCVDFSMQHILVMVLGNKIKNVIYAKQLILSMRTSSLQPNLQVEVSHHATALHVSSVQQAAPTQKYARTHRGLRGHHSLTSNILLNWVIPLSTASKLHFCFWDFFFLPSHICWASAWTGCHLLPRCSFDWTGTRCISKATRGYKLHTKRAQRMHWRATEALLSGREGNPAQRGSTETRQYSLQRHGRALLQELWDDLVIIT